MTCKCLPISFRWSDGVKSNRWAYIHGGISRKGRTGRIQYPNNTNLRRPSTSPLSPTPGSQKFFSLERVYLLGETKTFGVRVSHHRFEYSGVILLKSKKSKKKVIRLWLRAGTYSLCLNVGMTFLVRQQSVTIPVLSDWENIKYKKHWTIPLYFITLVNLVNTKGGRKV